MSMTHSDTIEAMISDDDMPIERVTAGAVGAIVKSEVEAQLDAAHRYPRSVAKFLREAMTLATVSQDVAEACIYSLPRDGKMISGPSVRLAEICASAYGNLHFGARIVDETDKAIVAQGGAWDLEKNTRCTVETRRRITGKSGRRFSDDMVVMTGNAAASIALRNAIFRVIPGAYVKQIYAKVREVAVGNAQTLIARRTAVLERLAKMGIPIERVLARVDKRGVEDVGLEELEVLIGLGTAIKNGDQQVDDAFPAVAPAPVPPEQDGKRISLKGKKTEKPTEQEPAADSDRTDIE